MFSQVLSRLPESWESMFLELKPEFQNIEKILSRHMAKNNYNTVFPDPENILLPYFLCPLKEVKVVIFAPEPYDSMCFCTKHPRATGLAYSVNKCDKIPDQLKNILDEIMNEFPDFNYSDGDISNWGAKGILLLNMSFTIQPGKNESHQALWLGIIKKTIMTIDKVNPKCIYVMWGSKCQEIETMLSNAAIKIKAGSPNQKNNGLYNSGNFKQISKITGIDWD